jgi:2-C-methyl-D-erythritol 4-phosphate cytidylyltransferase
VSSPSRRFALIPAAGSGSRFGAPEAKQYVALAGVPVLKQTLAALQSAIALDAVYVVLAAHDTLYAERIGALDGVVPIYCGGSTRAESVRNGLAVIGEAATDDDWVLVHDATRPCVDRPALQRLLHELEQDAIGGLLAMPLSDTLKRADANGAMRVNTTEPRDGLWCAQTPQMFRYAVLRRALAGDAASVYTDEAQAVEALGAKPRLVLGSPMNIKVTYPQDLVLAEAILASRVATS